MVNVELERVNGAFGFEAKDTAGHTVKIDTSPETGGEILVCVRCSFY